MNFGSVAVGSKATLSGALINSSTGDVTVKGAGAEALKVESTPNQPDGQGRASTWRIVLRALPESKTTTFSGTVTIDLDHPRVPKLEASYVAGR